MKILHVDQKRTQKVICGFCGAEFKRRPERDSRACSRVCGNALAKGTRQDASYLPRKAGNIVEIPLTQGRTAIVDARDFELVRSRVWRLHKSIGTFYAYSGRVSLHSLILGRKHVDHRDGNGLNNRRINLRPATKSQNGANSRARHNLTGFRGVCRFPYSWHAQITVHGEHRYLGAYATKEGAARAYDRAAIAAFGEFAVTNAALGRLNQCA